jgi:putative flavoprotein involved in K+ transport
MSNNSLASNGDTATFEVLVVGAGQAGLAIAWHLQRADVPHLVVDAGPEIGHVWRARWDSLRLFTPAEYDALPGMAFPAPASTYPGKDDVADYLRSYAETFSLPVRLNTAVTKLTREEDHFVAETTTGTVTARQVVIATGPFQTPVMPSLAAGLAPDVVQVHSSTYRNPAQLPLGPTLVVGAGNSGMQIARELAATRPVLLAVGSRPRQLPQRFAGRDLFWWMTRFGLLDKTNDSRLARRLQEGGDLVIGTRWADLTQRGVDLRPRLTGASGGTARFADGSLAQIGAVVWATGFRPDYSWLQVPGVLADGSVVHSRGRTADSGLSFLGLPWQHTRGSSLLGFVQHDAAWLAAQLVARANADAISASHPQLTTPAVPS